MASTKLLVSRYESLGSPAKPPVKKDIRQSFRNLLAVLGMRSATSKLNDPVRNLDDNPMEPAVQDPSAPAPPKKLAGSLFYLSRTPLVWTYCSAVLQGDSVHLSSPTTHSVLIKHCTDVRSMLPDELHPAEKALLPADTKDLKLFQVGFNGRTAEIFATTSVIERARWIGAIWDAILPTSNDRSCHTQVTYRDSESTTPVAHDTRRPSSICSYRALPPLPQSSMSPTPSLHLAVSQTPSIHPLTVPQSPSSQSRTRSKSPSIADLSHLSLVKQRLAQIESKQQSHSAPTSPSSRLSSLRVQIPAEAESKSLTSPTSILDSYAATLEVQCPDQDHPSDCQDLTLSQRDAHNVLLQDIYQMLSGIVHHSQETQSNLNIIQNKLGEPTDSNFEAVRRALEDIHQRLRSDLPYIIKSLADIQAGQAEAPPSCRVDKPDQILAAIREESLKRSVQSQQQTDTVRYLNELNSWLEAFVSGGTAQIQVVAANIDKLCKELGCTGEKDSILRRLNTNGEALQHSVNNLAAMIASESRNGFSRLLDAPVKLTLFSFPCLSAPQSVASLIDQQRQEQEGLLRALAAELSNEIRGERLRFVDAMKEATAINVQMHVEELKKELTREVRADLFAHYSRQTQSVSVAPGQVYPRQDPQPQFMVDPRYAPYS
ncbi:hypothetical protein GGX14DRAFT_541664 [Mycena pura]|uniref:PH domain-containing protein n=1 Tax=Mycena pura TaxID=153505 RepID=A0AAD6VRK8_9AGAR|nr:hypothetical protein GGX14DRAFT_541664 [Mycena pura]